MEKNSHQRLNPILLLVILLSFVGFLPTSAIAAEYTFTTLDVPGATAIEAHGIDGNNIVGYYLTDGFHGFLYDGSIYSSLDVPGAAAIEAHGIDGNNVVGHYDDAGGVAHGFLYDGSTLTPINAPGATGATYLRGISGNNMIGHYYYLYKWRGFLYDGLTYTSINVPGSQETIPFGIDGNNIVGYYLTDGFHGFLYDGLIYTSLDVPGAMHTFALGVDKNNIVGYYNDAGGVAHGFLYDGSTYTLIDVPGSTSTVVFGIDGNNIVGYYDDADYVRHGFLATPAATWITIDIRHGTDRSCFNQDDHGTIPVAILGSADLDVTQIEIGSLSLQGLAVKGRGKSRNHSARYGYVNADNYLDLIVQFQDSDEWIASGDGYATLTGKLNNGTLIEGKDTICVAPKPRHNKRARGEGGVLWLSPF